MVKKKKNKGCIYWDESSRGVSLDRPRGRWVGERLENGKRVRMRSTNYNNVLKWVTGNTTDCNRIQLKGLPGYSIDIERKEVFGKRGIPMKGHQRIGEESAEYLIITKERKITLSFNRLAYAALHDIDVRQIPSDLMVKYKDGEYVLMCRDDLLIENNIKRREENRRTIMSRLQKRMMELEMLQRYYLTGDKTEIVEYATKTCFNYLVAYIIRINRCGIRRATDIVYEGTEAFLQRTLDEDVTAVSITNAILTLCRKAMATAYRQHEYNDNEIYKQL